MDHKFGFLMLIAFLSMPFLSLGAVAHPAEEWNRTYRDLGWGLSDITPAVAIESSIINNCLLLSDIIIFFFSLKAAHS